MDIDVTAEVLLIHAIVKGILSVLFPLTDLPPIRTYKEHIKEHNKKKRGQSTKVLSR